MFIIVEGDLNSKEMFGFHTHFDEAKVVLPALVYPFDEPLYLLITHGPTLHASFAAVCELVQDFATIASSPGLPSHTCFPRRRSAPTNPDE